MRKKTQHNSFLLGYEQREPFEMRIPIDVDLVKSGTECGRKKWSAVCHMNDKGVDIFGIFEILIPTRETVPL